MLELIIFGFIIYTIFKKYNNLSQIKLISALRNQGFSNIAIIHQNQTNCLIKAILHGDNYLFNIIKDNSTISHVTINSLVEYASKNHYHNTVLVPGNSVISDMAKRTISKYSIEIWNSAKINEFAKSNQISSIIKTTPTQDTCQIEESNDPIQNGAKANTIFGNLFHSKIDKL